MSSTTSIHLFQRMTNFKRWKCLWKCTIYSFNIISHHLTHGQNEQEKFLKFSIHIPFVQQKCFHIPNEFPHVCQVFEFSIRWRYTITKLILFYIVWILRTQLLRDLKKVSLSHEKIVFVVWVTVEFNQEQISNKSQSGTTPYRLKKVFIKTSGGNEGRLFMRICSRWQLTYNPVWSNLKISTRKIEVLRSFLLDAFTYPMQWVEKYSEAFV